MHDQVFINRDKLIMDCWLKLRKRRSSRPISAYNRHCNYSSTQELGKPFSKAIGSSALALPHNEYLPAKFLKLASVFFVTQLIALQLWFPVAGSRFWHMRVDTAGMLVPETAPHFDDAAQPWEHQIRFARELRHVEPVPETHSVN